MGGSVAAAVRLISRLVLRAALSALDRFYHISRVGPPIPPGPVLVIANHPNSLMDALVILRIAGRPVRPLAKAPLFDQAVIGHVLRGLGALPVYRRQDLPEEMWRNDETFAAAVESLGRREAVLIFPEGTSHSEPSLAPMKTGAARIALRAESAAGWTLGLRIVPVGLTYERKHAFRGHVAAQVGEPIELAAWREPFLQDEWPAVEALTVAMREALEDLTLNLTSMDDRELIQAAESLYTTEKGEVTARERASLGARLPRLQRFARGLAWLRTVDLARYQRLARSVRTYRGRLALLGISAGELPERFTAVAVLRYALAHGAILLTVLPLAAAGTVAWYLPLRSPELILRWQRPAHEAVATAKLATAFVTFPLMYAVWIALGYAFGEWAAAVVLALAAPLAGLAALAWRELWDVVREDARVVRRAATRPRLREASLARRRALVAEFDSIAAEWAEEMERRREAGRGS